MSDKPPLLLAALGAVTLAFALAGVGLAGTLGSPEKRREPATIQVCTFGSSAIGPITVDADGNVSGDTTPERTGCTG